MLKVQQVLNGKIQEYTVQEDMENVVQRGCEIRFSLAHSTLIMWTLLGKQLRYLADEELAKAIIEGTFKIPAELDLATT